MARLVRPVVVGDGVLDSTDAADETQWNSGSTYALKDVRRGPAPYDKLIYESAQAGNLNTASKDDLLTIYLNRAADLTCVFITRPHSVADARPIGSVIVRIVGPDSSLT